MNTNNEWSIRKHIVQNHPLGFPRTTWVVREGGGQYAPGFCDACEDTMVLVEGNWDDGCCLKCDRGGASISWPGSAEELCDGVAAAMFPRDWQAEDEAESAERGTMTVRIEMPVKQYRQLIDGCLQSDVSADEAILGALVMAGLVKL